MEVTSYRPRSWVEEPDDIGLPPELDPCVQVFLSRTGSPGGDGNRSNSPSAPRPSYDDPQEWVSWHACQVETPDWWPELVKVLPLGT